jgi:hypothetical protein
VGYSISVIPLSEDSMDDNYKPLKIIVKLKTVIQKDVTDHYGHGRPTQKGLDEVKKYAQERLDQYIEEMKKESEELKDKWGAGNPLIIYARISLRTHTYEIDITTRDNPKAM